MKNLLFSLSLILVIFTSCKPEDELQITSISFDSSQVKINEGESITLTVKYSPSNIPALSYSWVSLSPSIATVENGIVKGLSEGTTKIRVTATTNQNLFDECTVIVKKIGTADNPYLIYTVQDLIKIRDSVNSGNVKFINNAYKLMADLDFAAEHYWDPIGPSPTVPFKGIFDGNGKVIKNITIGTANTTVTMGYAGLFGCINGGEVKNLGVQWIDISVTGIAGGIVGIILEGTKINNCFTTGDIEGGGGCGGIAGIVSDGEVTFCNSHGDISSGSSSGGVAADVSDGIINNCYSNGKISGSNSGGIIGIASNVITTTECFSTGDISGFNSGGIIGKILKEATITNCHSDGNIKSVGGLGPMVGGIAGFVEAVQMNNCYSTGNVSGDGYGSYCGGILGFARNGLLTNCSSKGNITSDGNAGGIAGNMKGYISNCYAIGDVSSNTVVNSYAGGIAGVLEGEIYNCYAAGGIFSTTTGTIFGSTYSSFACGIAPSTGIVRYCIALNTEVIATGNYFNSLYPQRIASGNLANSNNYAATTMVVQKVKPYFGTTTFTNFPYEIRDGLDLTGNPVDLLNNYVTANPTYNGITLLKWKAEPGVNNGNPIFQ